jgi:hypothetical protein
MGPVFPSGRTMSVANLGGHLVGWDALAELERKGCELFVHKAQNYTKD